MFWKFLVTFQIDFNITRWLICTVRTAAAVLLNWSVAVWAHQYVEVNPHQELIPREVSLIYVNWLQIRRNDDFNLHYSHQIYLCCFIEYIISREIGKLVINTVVNRTEISTRIKIYLVSFCSITAYLEHLLRSSSTRI